MKVGSVKEIKKLESRVGLTPDNAREFVAHGHEVYTQTGAGEGSGFKDADYEAVGANITASAEDVWKTCDMIVKVKEPLKEEYGLMRENLILYTYLHLAADRELTEALLRQRVKGVAYETIRDRHGGLPLLKPMSEVAGRLSIQEGAKTLEKPMGGMGVLLSGVPGVQKAKVVILGGGVVGTNAAKMALGFGADVTILDTNLSRLTYLDDIFGANVQTMFSTEAAIERELKAADLVIGAVLIPGASAPKLIKKKHLAIMKEGSVIVDVAVDQGGCCETTRATYHDAPTFVVDGVVHYCVANMPGAVARTSTMALTNATLPYGIKIAGRGIEAAAKDDPRLMLGINTYAGKVTCKGVAESLGYDYADPNTLF
jgi:alanine dehydrogenase